MPFHNALGVDVHYVEHGPSAENARHTAVLLHGFPLDMRMCLAAFEPLFSDRPHWRRIYLDFPGMGQTRAPEWVASTDDVFRITQEMVNALVPGRYAIGGCSYGGYIGAGLAAADPDRITGLALIVPMVLPHGQREVADHRLLVREPGLTGSETYQDLMVIITAETLRRSREEIDVGLAAADPQAVARIETSYGGSFPIVPPSGQFDCPALVLVGRQDNILGFNDQWRVYGQGPRTTFAVLDRGGHGLAIELPKLHDTLVGDWLDRVEADAASTPGGHPDGGASAVARL